MRLELDNELLFICSGLFVLSFWFFTQYCHSRKVAQIASSLIGALTLPAFVPGHGEVIMVLPNSALFIVASTPAHLIGLFFFVVNFAVLLWLFTWLSRRFSR